MQVFTRDGAIELEASVRAALLVYHLGGISHTLATCESKY